MQNINVMVVEDEGLVSLYLQKTLKAFGYKIAASAFSGEEALEKANTKKLDLVLMDYQLKGKLNGVETARLINQSIDAPVIFLTAHSNKDTMEEIIESAPFGYLLKPIDEKILYITIETALTRYRLEFKLKEQQQLVHRLNEELEERVKERTYELEISNRELKHQITLRGFLEHELRLSLEKEKELSELKSRFISTASHEFRTPLSIILSSSELLSSFGYSWNEDKKKELFSRIIVSVKHMTTLLGDILFLNKDDAGKLDFKPGFLDLKKQFLLIAEEVRGSDLHEWTINFKETGEGREVWLDEKLLHQMLNNLVSNAMKYSGDKRQIDLEMHWRDDEVEILVRDYGIGIPLADQERLFENFFRASNVGSIGGTGLGLSIVKRAVERHGGTIEMQSEEGQGTTFTVILPINQPVANSGAVVHLTKEEFNKGVGLLEQHLWLLERAVESTASGIFITDQEQEGTPVIYCNSGFERITGYNRDEVLGRNFEFLLGEDRDQPNMHEFQAALAEGRSTRIILRNYHKDGTLFLSDLSLSPIKDSSGKIVNFVGILLEA